MLRDVAFDAIKARPGELRLSLTGEDDRLHT